MDKSAHNQRASLGGEGPRPSARVEIDYPDRQPAITKVHDTLSLTGDVALRVMRLAETLCGASAEETREDFGKSSGIIPDLAVRCQQTDQELYRAMAALSRIEREFGL